MRGFRFIFVCVVVGIASISIHAQQTIKIMSWNIFMIPPTIFKSCQCERAPAISDYVKSKTPDIIVFQEAFQKKARQLVWENLKDVYPYETGVPKSGFLRTHSGVWIVSKHPIEKKEMIVYKKAKGSDKFAKKGATFVEVNINGTKVQVIGTHVQSGSKYQSTRNIQYQQIMDDLANKYFDPQIPQFIIGDLNTDYTMTGDYLEMIRILDVLEIKHSGEPYSWNGSENDLGAKFFGTHKEILDYVLLRKAHAEVAEIKKEIIYSPVGTTALCKRGFKALSDHYPVVAEIEFK